MEQVIHFKGLTLAGSELSASVGELAVCANLESHEGELRVASLEGESAKTLEGGDKLLYVHTADNEPRFIYTDDGGDICYNKKAIFNRPSGTVVSLSSIGNTLILLTTQGKYYALWKAGGYKELGDKPPMLNICFSLGSLQKREFYDFDDIDVRQGTSPTSLSYAAYRRIEKSSEEMFDTSSPSNVRVKEDARNTFTDAVWGLINKTNEAIAEHGLFYAPFYVRYCYTLYDGTSYWHSAPVLMTPVAWTAYQLKVISLAYSPADGEIKLLDVDGARIVESGEEGTEFHTYATNIATIKDTVIKYYPAAVKLQYMVRDTSANVNALKDWGDIVKSVDIYVSPQISAYNQGSQIATIKKEPIADSRNFITHNRTAYPINYLTKCLVEAKEGETYNRKSWTQYVVEIPKKDINDTFLDVSSFFKLHTLQTDSLSADSSSWHDITVGNNQLTNITTQAVLNDEYRSHHKIMADGQYVYNQRLHLYGIKEILFGGFRGSSMFPTVHSYNGVDYIISYVRVRIKTPSGYIVVNADESTTPQIYSAIMAICPAYYPDSRADMMEIGLKRNAGEAVSLYAKLSMRESKTLSGAISVPTTYRIDSYSSLTASASYITSKSENKLYVSKTNNPFVFAATGIKTVGTGSIVGVASATRPLSQGQFGQFPLMVFATDGIWALGLNTDNRIVEGLEYDLAYSSAHNISRDVCIDKKTILQLDQSVLFATDKALCVISGNEVTSLTDVLDGPVLGDTTELAESMAGEGNDLKKLAKSVGTPIELLKKGNALYDAAKGRVIFFGDEGVAMILSLKDNVWSTMQGSVTSIVNGYPYPYVQIGTGIYKLGKGYNNNSNEKKWCMILTRTLSFSQSMDAIKTIYQAADGEKAPELWIFGRNDPRKDWNLVGKTKRFHADYLPGHTYRYFRIGIVMEYSAKERYSFLSLDVINKYRHL